MTPDPNLDDGPATVRLVPADQVAALRAAADDVRRRLTALARGLAIAADHGAVAPTDQLYGLASDLSGWAAILEDGLAAGIGGAR